MTFTAQAAEPIGAAIVVVNQVTARLDDTRTLQQGDGVHQNEMIEVATDASSELKLNDDTKLALGPGAKLLLDKFVYDANEPKSAVVVNLAKGAFRFITGIATKPSYVVRVPQASITVRGTIFDVFVEDNGFSWLLLHEGAVTVCNDRGKCRDLDEPGKLICINDDGDVETPQRWSKLPRKKSKFGDVFPFVEKKPQQSPEVLSRDAILIDVALPPKKKRKVHDHKTHDDRADKPKKKREKVQKADYEKPSRTKKRRVARSYDKEAVIDGVNLAIGIAGRVRFGGGGGGGRYGPSYDRGHSHGRGGGGRGRY